MKIACETDIIHFEDEFKDTFKPPCNFWGDMGLANIEVELKKKIWEDR